MGNRLVRYIATSVVLISVVACQHRLIIDPALIDNPQDPGVLSGTLDNGFTYYLRSANSSEQKRNIEIRLVVRVGSIHEKSSERGYAHLLEHLVFRGTKNFTGMQIESLLEEAGLRWGVDVNATTHYGATVYRFSLTENEAELMPAILALAADFMSAVNVDEADLAREKKIVEAEWRFRYGHRNFVVDPLTSAALTAEPFKNRPPVGVLKTVRAATTDSLNGFWKRNYRAANAALIVTGNIVPWELEKLVEKRFKELHGGSIDLKPKKHDRFKLLKGGAEVEHLSFVNPDLVSPQVSLNFVSRVKTSNTVESMRLSFREDLLFKAVGHMITSRLSASSRCNASTLHSSLLESGQSVNRIEIDVSDSDYLSCLKGLSSGSRQLFENGLTSAEYDQLQQSFRTIAVEQADNYRNSTPEDLATRITQLVVYGTPVLPASFMESAYLEMIDSINVTEFNNSLAEIPSKYKIVYTTSGPVDNNLPKKELMALATESSDKFVALTPSHQILHGVLNPDQLFSNLVGIGGEAKRLKAVVSEEKYREWKLSNGARVVFHQDDRFDYVALAAVAPGGYLMVDKKISKAARMLPRFAGVNGAGGYLQKSLRRLKSEKSLFSEIQVNPTHHGIFAYSVSDDVALLMELVSAYFDELIIVEPTSSNLLARLNTDQQCSDSASGFWRYLNNADDITLETSHMRQAQSLLYHTPADFTFVIVGNVEADILARELTRLERHSEQSFAPKVDSFALVEKNDSGMAGFRAEDGRQRLDVSLFHECTLPVSGRSDANLNLQLLADIIERRLRYDIREERGLSYPVQTRLLTDSTGADRRYHQIDYSVRSQDTLQAQVLVSSVLNAIGKTGVTEQELRLALKRERKRRRDLSYNYLAYASEMAFAIQHGATVKDPAINHVSLEQLNKMANCFSSDNTTLVLQNGIASPLKALSFD